MGGLHMRRRDVCEIVERNDTGLALKRKGTGEELPGGCVVLGWWSEEAWARSLGMETDLAVTSQKVPPRE